MSTLAQFRAEIRSLGNFPANDTRITDSTINREINRALKRIAMVHDWPWLQTERPIVTAAGQQNYRLFSDFLRLISIRHTDDARTLFIRNKPEFDEIFGDGRPCAFCIWGGDIRLAPVPVDVETLMVTYVRQENVLENDADEPLIPSYWEEGLVDCALASLYLIANRPDDASIAEGRFQQWVTDTQDNVMQTRQAPRIRVRPGGFI